MGINRNEQLLLFRGRKIEEPDLQPLNDPSMEEIINEAGDAGLQMTVKEVKIKTPPFVEREGLKTVADAFPTKATVLHRATRRCDLFVIEELVSDKNTEFNNFDARDNKGQTALHTAATCNFREIADLLLKCSRFTEVGAKDKEGKTALHYAAFFGDERMCKSILQHEKFTRRHAEARDQFGNTALAYATHCGHVETVKVILEIYPDLPKPPPLVAVAEVQTNEVQRPVEEPVIAKVSDTVAKPATPAKAPEPAEDTEPSLPLASSEAEQQPDQDTGPPLPSASLEVEQQPDQEAAEMAQPQLEPFNCTFEQQPVAGIAANARETVKVTGHLTAAVADAYNQETPD